MKLGEWITDDPPANYREFNGNRILETRISRSKEIQETYEKGLFAKIILRVEFGKDEQHKGDIKLYFSRRRKKFLEIFEEKFRPFNKRFYQDVELEIKHINIKGCHYPSWPGWLYTSDAKVLAYFQQKADSSWFLTFWKLQEIKQWSKTDEFSDLRQKDIIKEPRWARSKKGTRKWKTQNYAVPYYILIERDFMLDGDNIGNEIN